ncbi:MAG: hypothetical protein AABX83_03455 [Nanoarchaeota archaeon]|mgnify:CR=1 FL=1
MSSQKVRTSFEDYESQVFPISLDKLNSACNNSRINLQILEAIARTISNYRSIELYPVTEDKYDWHCGLYFENRRTKIAILFPWQQDFVKSDGTALDRSVAVYIKGRNEESYIDSIIKKLTIGLI